MSARKDISLLDLAADEASVVVQDNTNNKTKNTNKKIKNKKNKTPVTAKPTMKKDLFGKGAPSSAKTASTTATSTKKCTTMMSSPIMTATRHLVQPNGTIVGRHIAAAIRDDYPTFAAAIPCFPDKQKHHAALASIDGRTPISHARIQTFVQDYFGPKLLHVMGFGKGDRIALVLPNGPELALAIVATAQWSCAVPLSATAAPSELQADLQRCGATLVIGPYSGPMKKTNMTSSRNDNNNKYHILHQPSNTDWQNFRFIEDTAKRLGIPFCGLVPSPHEAGIFTLVTDRPSTPLHYDDLVVGVDDSSSSSSSRQYLKCLRPITTTRQKSSDLYRPSAASDEVLVLFTSGTTGNKKLVPHCLGDMLTASVTIAQSWALTTADVNCNLMPLFHVGGIVRQVFAPIISGGCVICCPSFDPSLFWALLERQAFTWYYAAPTMHQLILQTGKEAQPSPTDGHHQTTACYIDRLQPRLRMIANAAGGLLPSLAVELRQTFGAHVLPSYGMTECMPISSPPANYQLEKPGTSGVAVGPEVAILNVTTDEILPAGQEGAVCVRGEPCFRGYGALANDPDQEVEEAFNKDGWFNTGDLGYMDKDGYLYITGRSKEVINRGGEIISPMEVEEAILSHPDVQGCAAFSAPHDILQEVVGIALVMNPCRPRLDLSSLQEYVSNKLATPKWPQCLVFMDNLPKSHTNKLLRVKLGTRLNIPKMNDDMLLIDRTFEAACPPQGTGLEVPITASPVCVWAGDVEARLIAELITRSNQHIHVVSHPGRNGHFVCYVRNVDRLKTIEVANKVLDRYAVPSHIVTLDNDIEDGLELTLPKPTDSVASILDGTEAAESDDPVVHSIQELFVETLSLDYTPSPYANFFRLGGSSLLASHLASHIRKQFDVSCSGANIFQYSTCHDLAEMIRGRNTSIAPSTDRLTRNHQEACVPDAEREGKKSPKQLGLAFSSQRLKPRSNVLTTVVQLLPLFVVFPVWQITRYLLFFVLLLWSLDSVPSGRDISTFIASYLFFYVCWITLLPLVFVAIKWIVIGRYKKGRYAVWSSYYLRWWFVDICRKLFLRGIWASNTTLLNFYYRLLGAKIDSGARLSPDCLVAEFDLVQVGKNARIDSSVALRGFGVDNGAMLLDSVVVGNDASVGIRSVVAPGTQVPDSGHLGPGTSSYEDAEDLDEKHASVNQQCVPKPNPFMQTCVAGPIMFFVSACSLIPPIAVLMWMLHYKGQREETFSSLSDLMKWLCDPQRIPFYIGIRVARAMVSPFTSLAAAILVKRLVIGKFTAGPLDKSSQWQLTRHYLSEQILSRKRIQDVTDLIGRHYGLVSILYRMLGAKIGKRVFWPGRQPVFSGEFDLLEVGDDVVFGSRTSILFSTVDSCEKVILCAGSNVSDNCIVLPGAIVGKNAVLGSNSVCPRGWYLPEGSVWFGAKKSEPSCLEWGNEPHKTEGWVAAESVNKGRLQMEGDDSTLRPFGKALYLRQATYFVWPISWIVALTFLTKLCIAVFHTMPLLAAFHGAAAYLYGFSFAERTYDTKNYSLSTLYVTVLVMFIGANMVRIAMWLVVELTAKWTIMGQRKVGRYNYDQSSYAQRWELYQLVAKIRKANKLNFLEFLSGTPFMSWYFRWNGAKIGRDCCLFPTGADPFPPEPDLLQVGDRCAVDCAAMVCHLNTRGNFALSPVVMENDCTLRRRSRIQQGVHMETGSMVLEKSVVMTGEVVEANTVWQGAPAALWFQYSLSPTTKSVSWGSTDVGNNGNETASELASDDSFAEGAPHVVSGEDSEVELIL